MSQVWRVRWVIIHLLSASYDMLLTCAPETVMTWLLHYIQAGYFFSYDHYNHTSMKRNQQSSRLISLCPFRPLVSSLGLGLVDPGLVDVYWVGPDAESSVQQDVLQSRTQRLPQGVLTASVTVKVHQHLDDGGVTCDNVLRLLHLQSDIITQRQVNLGNATCN